MYYKVLRKYILKCDTIDNKLQISIQKLHHVALGPSFYNFLSSAFGDAEILSFVMGIYFIWNAEK